MNSLSWIHLVQNNVKFMKLKSCIRECKIVNSWSWNIELMKLKSWNHGTESWSSKHEFVKLKSWIHQEVIVNSWIRNCESVFLSSNRKFRKMKKWIREVKFWNRSLEFMKLKWCPNRSFVENISNVLNVNVGVISNLTIRDQNA
jgi:hypothetical protein